MELGDDDEFFIAIQHGEIEVVTRLLLQGRDVNAGLPEDDLKPLHMAVKSNQLNICKLLIKYGADINMHDKYDGWNAIHWAAQPDVDAEIMKFLIESGADANAKTLCNRTPLHEVMFKYSPAKLFTLFKAGVQESLNTRDFSSGAIPLISAIQHLHNDESHQIANDGKLPCVVVCKELIRRGSLVNSLLNNYSNGLHVSAHNGCYEVMEILLKNGCRVNQRDKYGCTPMHALITTRSLGSQSLQSARVIEEAVVAKHMSKSKQSLNTAGDVFDGIQAKIILLLKYGGELDIPSIKGNTLLHSSCRTFNIRSKEFLLQHGADVNARNNTGMTPLHSASIYPDDLELILHHKVAQETMECLLKHGADIEAADVVGWTALHYTLYAENYSSSALLLRTGANVNAAGVCGVTPLHLAVSAEDVSILDLILGYNPQKEVKDMYGATPLFYAVYHENQSIVKMLLNSGFDIHVKDNLNRTVWDIAKFFNAVGILEVLDDFVKTGMQSCLDDTENNLSVAISDSDEVCSSRNRYVSEQSTLYKTIYLNQTDGNDESSEDSKEDDEPPVVLSVNDVDQWLIEGKWKCEIDLFISDFVKKPLIMNQEEHILARQQIKILMERICTAVRNLNLQLQLEPVLSGSVSEGTKITFPDEYDFLLILSSFDGKVDVVEENDDPASYCKVHLKDYFVSDPISRFFSGDSGFLDAEKLFSAIYGTISKVLSNADLWRDLGLIVRGKPEAHNDFINCLDLLWIGPVYKGLQISVDLVPAIKLTGWWPKTAMTNRALIKQRMKDIGCVLITKPVSSFRIIERMEYMRMSFSLIETNIFCTHSETVQKGYMLAKAIRDVSPRLLMFEGQNIKLSIEKELSTYILKTSLFEGLENGSIISDVTECEGNVRSVAHKIWSGVHEAVQHGVMSSFFVQEYKIYDGYQNDYLSNHVKAFAKIMLAFLK